MGAAPDSTIKVRGGTLSDPYAGLTQAERVAKKRAELGPSTLPKTPDITDDLLQQSAASTVARLRKGMGRRSTFLDSAIGDPTLLGDL